MLISTKDFLMEWMKRLIRKLTEKYIGPYVVKKIVSENVVELEFPALLRIHLVINMRRISKLSRAGRGTEEDSTFSSRDRKRERV